MAINWSAVEATEIIITGEDNEAIKNITRRFPLFVYYVLRDPLTIIKSFDMMTARTLNKRLEDYVDSKHDKKVQNEKITISPEKFSKTLELGKKKKEKVSKDANEVEEAKHAIVEDIAKKVNKEATKLDERKEETRDKKEGTEGPTNKDLDFDIEHLLE